ncbi:MAG: ABC transporter ATP-binding protein [Mycobacteriales bacterium]
MSELAIEAFGLVKRYGDRTVVDGVSFTAAPGRVLALLGPNGAGKTTTVEMCEGYRAPDAGRVRVLGFDPIADRRRLAPAMGVMLQDGGVYPAGRPAELLALFASFCADPVPPATLIDRLGLGAVARTPYRRLSGGEKQRLSLALAVVGRPSVLFLDEPTTGLDPQARAVAWELVAELRGAGACVLLTTHNMNEAQRLADDVLIVDGGRIIAAGTPTELTSGDARTISFNAPADFDIDAFTSVLPVGCAASRTVSGEVLVTGPTDAGTVALVAAWCAQRGLVPDNLRFEARSLEDVFLQLTGRELRP